MLPPGHIAAGFLVAEAVLKAGHPALSTAQQTELLIWGAFFGFAPDLDFFYEFASLGRFRIYDKDPSHRQYISHAPVVWLIAGLLIFFVSSNDFYRYFGLLLWLCSWSHFALDTIQSGIRWAWPLSNKIFALRDKEIESHIHEQKFFPFWLQFVRFYVTRLALSFYLEISLIIFAVWFIIR